MTAHSAAGIRTLDDLGDLAGKTALLRADLNVPMKDGAVTDDTRIRASVGSIRALMDKGAKVAVMSHFGRPKGAPRSDMSLRPLVGPLSDAIGTDVTFASECIGTIAAEAVKAAEPVVLLENLRFHPGEEANDPEFAEALAALGDVYVNDAFSAAHRAHASTEAIARLLPSAAGLSMMAEISALESALAHPERPVAAIVGGAKISTKLGVLGHLLDRVDHLMIGGAMANTFLAAQDIDIGQSLTEPDMVDDARRIMEQADRQGCKIHLPDDVVVAKTLEENTETRIAPVTDIRADDMVLDIGPKAVSDLEAVLIECRTLLWNGPLGAFEVEPFDRATVTLARKAAALSRAGVLVTIAGGGDTVAALNKAGIADDFSHVSTAGGAFLEWLEGKTLPGVAVLKHDQTAKS